jgi:hypothetical protein
MLYMPPLRYMQPEAADGPPCVNGSLHDEPNAGEVDDTLGVVAGRLLPLRPEPFQFSQ